MSVGQMKILKAIMGPFSRWQARRYLRSGGQKAATLQGRDICVVTMKGAKTGATRHIPLMYVPYENGVILVASLGGAPKHPVWYHNLIANPDVEVQVKGESLALRARQASAEEKAKLWPVCCHHYPDYQAYQDRSTRDIPVFLCEPRT
jgi:deazaflavin-dependent oxidoreductase (nitroreductase family)